MSLNLRSRVSFMENKLNNETILNYILNFIEKQWKLIASFFVLIIAVGFTVLFVFNQSVKKEQNAQAEYFKIEKNYIEFKSKKNTPPLETDKAAADKKTTVADLPTIKNDFQKIMTEFPGTKAAQMSALYSAEILSNENNKALALETLQKVKNQDSGLVNTLVQHQIAILLADQDKCTEAIGLWQKIIDKKEAQFIQTDAKIQQALCYNKMKDTKKAEEILTNLANQKPEAGLDNSTTTKEAEKYLRLIQFKKASGT